MSSPDPTEPVNRRPKQRGSTEEYIEHAHYYIIHTDAHLPGRAREVDGQLLYPAPKDQEDGGICVLTGTMFGPVVITVETYDSPQEAVADPGDWEIVQEVGIIARGADLHIVTEPLVETELPRLHLAPGEAAGVRLHARGYRKAVEAQEIRLQDGPIEHHLLQLWRA